MPGVADDPKRHLQNMINNHERRLVALEGQQLVVVTDPTKATGDPNNGYATFVLGYLGNVTLQPVGGGTGSTLTGYGAAAWHASAGWTKLAPQ